MQGVTVTADGMTQPVSPEADPRRFGSSTDDAAIFLEDTIDRTTVRCISDSPSAIAILTPQRLPSSAAMDCAAEAIVVATPSRLTASHVWASTSALFTPPQASEKENSHPPTARCSAMKPRARPTPLQSCTTNMNSVDRTDNVDAAPCPAMPLRFSHSPAPRACSATMTISAASGDGTIPSAVCDLGDDMAHVRRRSTRRSHAAVPAQPALTASSPSPSPAAVAPPRTVSHEAMVSLADYRRLERDRDRRQLMYEHQKLLYETMAEKHDAVYKSLQEKIVEVVALSSRNEESKRFIRQLKREIAESRTRVMEIQNRALEETRLERSTRARYEALIAEHERQQAELLAREATKTAALESLLEDLHCMKSEGARMYVGQLDALLRAAYAKNTALFGDLLAQGRQMDLLYASNADLATRLEEVRKEKAAVERAMGDERRRMTCQTERFLAQIAEQQKCILDLSQLLVREVSAVVVVDEEGEAESAEAAAARLRTRRDTRRGGRAASVAQNLARIAAFLLSSQHPEDNVEEDEAAQRNSVESRQSSTSSSSASRSSGQSASRSSGQSAMGPRLVLNDDDDVVGDDEDVAEMRRTLRIVHPIPHHADRTKDNDCNKSNSDDDDETAIKERVRSLSDVSATRCPVLTEYPQRGCTAASFRTKSVSRHSRSRSTQARRAAVLKDALLDTQAKSASALPPSSSSSSNTTNMVNCEADRADVPTIPTAHVLHIHSATSPTTAANAGSDDGVGRRSPSLYQVEVKQAGTSTHAARAFAVRSSARHEPTDDDDDEEEEEEEEDDRPRLAPQLTRLTVSSTRPPLTAYDRNVLIAPHKMGMNKADNTGDGCVPACAMTGNGVIHTRTTSRPRR